LDTLAILPPHSADRYDAGCSGVGADRVAGELAMNSPLLEQAESPPKPKWRWFNFSLKTLLIVMTVIALWLGIYMKSFRDRRKAVDEVEQLEGAMGIRYLGPDWLRKKVNDEKYFWDPAGVHFNRPLTVTELKSILPYLMSFQHLHDLTLHGLTNSTLPLLFPLANKLTYLDLSSCKLSDDAIVQLEQFPKLKTLRITNSDISSAGVEKLQRALPACKVTFQ
jgi:hypothetical protein